jgi:hypothetical protein
MLGTAAFPHHVANPRIPRPDGLCEHTAAADTAVDLVDAHTPPRDLPLPGFLRPRQLLPAWRLRGWDDGHPVPRACLNAPIVQALTPR